MARIIRYPFRFALDGSVATVEQDTDDANGEQIAILAITRAGERRLRPGFGLTDTAFVGFNASEMAAKLALYGPPVDLSDIRVAPVAADTQRVTIDFASEPAA